MSGCTRRKATSVLGKGIEKLDADRPSRDEHDLPWGAKQAGEWEVHFSNSLIGSQCCRRDNPWCYSRRDERERGKGWAGTGGHGTMESGAVASQGPSSLNLAISKSGQIGP